jgi:molybdate transport system substrate-binding protein
MGEKKADVFLTYCTNAVLAQKEVQALKIIRIPEELSVGADYGLLVRRGRRMRHGGWPCIFCRPRAKRY